MKARIRAIASHLPEHRLTNEQLNATFPDWDAEKIFQKTGIKVRRIAAATECASDLATLAAQKLFATGCCAPSEVDFLLFCTQSPDYVLPSTACLIQTRLGLSTRCDALDFNQGCSGFVYGLALAKSLIENGTASTVLLLTGETYSKYINPQDRSTKTIFGDGATATLVTGIDSNKELVGPFVLGTDGRGENNLLVPAGGMRLRSSPETKIENNQEGGNRRSLENLYMNGPEIFNFTLQAVPAAVTELLQKSALTINQIDQFVFHQANGFMLERLRAKLQIPVQKFCLELESVGNTVSSTIPIALERAIADGRIRSGQTIMLVGFGVGYSWAACMIQL